MSAAHTYHFPISFLQVPEPWTVGPVEFLPSPMLAQRLLQAADAEEEDGRRQFLRLFADRARATECATAAASAESADAALAIVRDAVAILRLYQRARRPRIDFDRQTFGAPGDLGTAVTEHWEFDDGRLVGGGVRRLWNIGDFAVPPEDLPAFAADPRFAYLDRVLRASDDARSDLDRRFLKALRVLARANVMLEEPIRVALLAVSLEQLLGDLPREGRTHRIACRAAYLTCRDEPALPRHGPSRPACFYLTAKSQRQVVAEMKRLRAANRPNACSFYIDIAALIEDRNAVLHEFAGASLLGEVRRHQSRVDDVILTMLEWAAATGAVDLQALDDEIAAAARKQGHEKPE